MKKLAVLIFKGLFIFIYVCGYFACTYNCVSWMPGAPGGQDSASVPPELEVRTVVSHHVDARNQTRPSRRAASAGNLWAISPAQVAVFLVQLTKDK